MYSSLGRLVDDLLRRGAHWGEAFWEDSAAVDAEIVDDVVEVRSRDARGIAVRGLDPTTDRFGVRATGSLTGARRIIADLFGDECRAEVVGQGRDAGAGSLELSADRHAVGVSDLVRRIPDVLAGVNAGILDAGAERGRGLIRLRQRRYIVLNSDGCRARAEVRYAHVRARAYAGAHVGYHGVAHTGFDLNAGDGWEVGHRAAMQAVRLQTASVPKSGPTAVVFGPVAAGVLVHETIGHALEADNALAGSALWAARGRQVTHVGFTVTEDGRAESAWERVVFDEEGAPLAAAPLLVGGVVVGVVSDLESARRLGADASTGNARRGSFVHRPAPRTRHTVLAPGDDDTGAIIGDTADGILVESIDIGQADTRSGRFTMRAREAREIRHGVAGRLLSGFTVAGDLSDFARLDAIGNDSHPVHALCGRDGHWLPISGVANTLRLPGLTVHGSSR